MKNLTKYLKGFTLVELVIVITILAILATIAFVSFQGYVKDARDGNRITTLKNIEKGLDLFKIQTTKYPQPDNYTLIQASGTTLGFQGYIGEDISKKLRINKIPVDPFDQKKYIYSLNSNKTKYQLLTFMEKQKEYSYYPQAYAQDYSSRVPKVIGDTIGIFLEENNNSIGGETIDILTTHSGSVYKVFFSDIPIISTGKYLLSTFILGNKELSYLDQNLVGYWDMNTLIYSGGIKLLKDYSQYGNHGNCFNSGIIVSCGSNIGPQLINGGGGMEFDGIDDLVNIPWQNIFIMSDFTLVSKFKHSGAQEANVGGGWRVVGSQGPTFTLFYTRIDDTYRFDGVTPTLNGRGGVEFSVSSGSTVEFAGVSQPTDLLDKNYHVIGNVKGTHLKTFIDGVKKGEQITNLGTINTQASIIIGALALNTNQANFSGEIDEIRIYNRALSDDELKNMYSLMR